MLHFMRKHAKFFYVFFFLIIISFIFFYVGPVDQTGDLPLIEIGKDRVSLEEYWRAYENTRRFYREVYQEEFDADMERELNLKEKVLIELISEKVLVRAARDAGLRVTDAELLEVITNEAAFQRDGVFRKDVYLNTLRLNRITARYYEERKREELLAGRMRRIIESTVLVPEAEIPVIAGNESLQKTLRESMINARKAQAVEAFVVSMRSRFGVVVRAELIS